MMLALLLVAFVGQSLAATTMAPHSTHAHKTHATREPFESETFRYDPHTHVMAVLHSHKCYIYSMSTQESVDVHTSTGLHALEAKVVTMIDDTTATYSTMTHEEVMKLSHQIARSCNHNGWTSYKLN